MGGPKGGQGDKGPVEGDKTMCTYDATSGKCSPEEGCKLRTKKGESTCMNEAAFKNKKGRKSKSTEEKDSKKAQKEKKKQDKQAAKDAKQAKKDAKKKAKEDKKDKKTKNKQDKED